MTKEWFAVNTYSGFENKVKQNIEHRAVVEGFRQDVGRVIVPSETVVEIRNGKKKDVSRNFMPGYVLVEMEPKGEIFEMVKKIAGVSRFVGDGQNASPMTSEEVENILNLMEDKREKPKPEIKYRKGEQVKVIEGPFTNFIGMVDEIDSEKSKLKVMVSIFGRPTPVELDVLQVEAV